ncbi:MAG TPA: class I SAM-dependent methyltransferase, partial [Armatimonadetes bacterium]|nr:class I SAM-dependent methyltransferase [Armatimonadota bacterium]
MPQGSRGFYDMAWARKGKCNTVACTNPSLRWCKWMGIAIICIAILLTMHIGIAYRTTMERPPAEQMARTALTLFKPVYPALAKQIVQDTGITRGICIELGCGAGSLAIELAKLTQLKIYALDIDPQAVRIAQEQIVKNRLGERVYAMWGDACNLPFRDSFADLIISRGMIPFINDKAKVFREAWRVLKPNGAAYIGGGFSRLLSEKQVQSIVSKTIWQHRDRLPIFQTSRA